MKKWLRHTTAMLAVILGLTSTKAVQAAGTAGTQQNMWKSTAVAVLADHYGLSSNETAVLQSGAVKAGAEYQAAMPYANGTTGKVDLTAVDYQTKTVYAKAYETDGYTWKPDSAVLTVEGEEIEQIPMNSGTANYEDESYDASGIFTYDGHSYTVTVTYELSVTIDSGEQERILSIPQILGQSVQCLEQNLKGSNINLKGLQEAAPYLNTLLYEKFPTAVEGETASAFDSAKDADVIWAIRRMNSRCKDGKELGLYTLSETYKSSGSGRLSFAIAHGQEVIDAANEIKADLTTLRNSTALSTAISKVQKTNPELYSHVRNVPSILRSLAGTEKNPGTVLKLADTSNWEVLDPYVRGRLLMEDADNVSMARLEAAVYALRNKILTVPEVDTESFCAAKSEVSCIVQLYDVTVTFQAQTASGRLGDAELLTQEPKRVTITLPAGLTAEEVQAAIKETGEEEKALEQWNSLADDYHINVANYERTESSFKGVLNADMADYQISYVPRSYTVKTNFAEKKMTAPYGYRLEFPANDDPEIDYDYVVETADGTRISYEQGTVYIVGADVTVTQTTGTKKQEYRLYDFLADDERYGFSEEVQRIYRNTAIKSPWLKIRMPEEDASGQIETKGTTCTLKAQESGSGISGMTWKPVAVLLMKNGQEIKRIAFDEKGVATWKKVSGTYAIVRYELQITKVKTSLIGYQPLTTDMMVVALNIPDALVRDTWNQNELLGGDGNSSAKSVFAGMNKYKGYLKQSSLDLIAGVVQTEEAKNAVKILMTSEKEKVTGANGEKLGYGGFNGDYNPEAEAEDEKGNKYNPTDKIALYRYLELSEQAGWSLAESYTSGRYQKIAEQAQLVADCLTAITNDQGFMEQVSKVDSLAAARDEILSTIPGLQAIAKGLTGPNTNWIREKDPGFSSLIEDLLAAKGKLDYNDVTGIIAINTPRKTSLDTGVLTVTMQVGNKKAQTREISYEMPETDSGERSHTFTETDLERLNTAVSELETACGMTDTEKNYYGVSQSEYPAVGQKLGYSETVTILYTPNTYKVTIKGVDSKTYEATLTYGDTKSYVIKLPRLSNDKKSTTAYRYTVGDKTIDVPNGSTDGNYTFKKADLTTLFSNGNHYEMSREEIKVEAQTDDTKKDETQKTDEKTTKKTDTSTADKKTDTSKDDASDSENTDTEGVDTDDDSTEAVDPTVEIMDNEVASQNLKGQGTGTKKGVHIPWWLILLLVLLIVAGLGLLFWDLWKKRIWAKNSKEGAPLVHYDIEEDDGDGTSAGGSNDGQ